MQVWNVLHAARWNYRTQKVRKNWPSAHHHTILLGYIFATKACIDNLKNLLNSNISSICSHNMVNFRRLTAETVWWVWGTPANFNGVPVLASLLQRRRSMEVHQTLCDVWPSAGLVYCINIFVRSCPLTEFCQAQIHVASKSCVLLFWQCCCHTLRHGTRNGIVELLLLIIFNRGRHLYSEGGHHVGHRPTF